MSTGTEATPSPDAEGLQFDHAEFAQAEAPSSIACASCRRPIAGAYYEVNGTIFCEDCRILIERQVKGGSKIGRLARASIFGSGAAIAGAAIYGLAMYVTDWQIGLVSILCGIMVGKAVRAGTGNRGGWIYQVMAVLLTYLAIGAAYAAVGMAHGGFQALMEQHQKEIPNATPASGYFFVGVMFCLSTVLLPILSARSNPLLLAIIGFALWEAWKFTRRAKVVITGPYRVGGDVVLDLPAEKAAGDA